ncbi:hypothetical protein SSS_10209, partial [Sarcoptes scabiei]
MKNRKDPKIQNGKQDRQSILKIILGSTENSPIHLNRNKISSIKSPEYFFVNEKAIALSLNRLSVRFVIKLDFRQIQNIKRRKKVKKKASREMQVSIESREKNPK